MRKLFIAAIVVLFVSSAVPLNTQDILLFKMEDNPFGSLVSLDLQPNQFSLSIWVDKGCGGEYFVGDILTVNWEASHPCWISFWEVEPNGEIRILNLRPIYADDGTGSTKWTLEDYGYGRRAIFAEAYSQWGEDTAECEYYVVEKAADIQVTVLDQDGEPISGAQISISDTFAATTDAGGISVIPDVPFGEYTITVAVGDDEQTRSIQIASTQELELVFVFTVEKRGTIKVSVHDQQGNPLPLANVYIDRVRKGNTLQDGTFTTTASEGKHSVTVTWQNETASQSVMVERNQTSSVQLTILIEIETQSLPPETKKSLFPIKIRIPFFPIEIETPLLLVILLVVVAIVTAAVLIMISSKKEVSIHRPPQMWLTEKKIAQFWVYPYLKTTDHTYSITLAIVKGLYTGEYEPLLSQSVDANLLDVKGNSLVIVQRPPDGPLPEVGGQSVSANAVFTFAVSAQKLKSLAVTIRGETKIFAIHETTPVIYKSPFKKRPGLLKRIFGLITGLFHKCCISTVEIPKNRSGRQVSGSRLYESFHMYIDFVDRGKCRCNRCEFRQYIRGYYTFNGVEAIHQLPDGPLDPVAWREDGVPHHFGKGHHMFYGHRDNPETPNDIYNPERATGHEYRGADTPMVAHSDLNVAMEMNLEFRGDIIDVKTGKVIHTATWKVYHTK